MAKTDAELLVELRTIRENVITQLKEMSRTFKPSYSIDGQKIDWREYRESLMKQLQDINEQISLFDDLFEQESTMYT